MSTVATGPAALDALDASLTGAALPAPTPSRRGSGILLHPTSLPGPYGIGDLGPTAYKWVDTLVRAGQKWWQVLPLGPTGYGDSPYQCFSAMAGNPYLISPTSLIELTLIDRGDIPALTFPTDRVDFGPVIEFKVALLEKAWENFKAGRATALQAPFEAFVAAEKSWLDDFGLFMALKDAHGGDSWLGWDLPLRLREPAALAEARALHADRARQHQFRQYLFFSAWGQVKEYANAKGVRLIGDIPIFVSSDSSDVWANPEIFLLDAERQPLAVAGVPPDYFSATGQMWGNPLYDWQALRATGYAWWVERFRASLKQVDVVRLDHFRGFEAYWRIPAGMPTAEVGEWEKGPGADFLTAVEAALGKLPIIAEDLGVITPEVEALRVGFGLPGMKILQFAFGGAPEDRFLPHTYAHNCVVYTGTHDNDTTRGWYEAATEPERDFARRYLGRDGREMAWDMLRLAWSSVADLAVAPLQDVLSLGTEARMNLPGRASGNWGWRYRAEMLTPFLEARLAELTELYAR